MLGTTKAQICFKTFNIKPVTWMFQQNFEKLIEILSSEVAPSSQFSC